MKKTLISVIIPSFNRKPCIMDAVESVLRQDDKRLAFEVIISDDGSTDGTSDLFKNFRNRIGWRVKYFYHKKNKGVNAARNFAIKKAEGEYLLLLDSDDSLSPDAGRIIGDSLSSMGKVNFFGTSEVKSGRPLYFLKKKGRITYAEWLDRKVLDGEFDPIVHKSVFRRFMFDERRFCFEGFFWNQVIREYGLVAFDKVIRLYSFEQDNRVSKKLLQVEYAKKRFDDYKRYSEEFGPDYKRLKLGVAYAKVLEKLSIYAMLSGDSSAARKAMNEALSLKKSLRWILIRMIYSFGPIPFRLVYAAAKMFVSA